MKASAKSIIITPKMGIEFAGNVRVDNKARGVHDHLLCNAILLDDEHGSKICFLGFDLCFLSRELCVDIKKIASSVLNIDKEYITISATHTHSGPDVADTFKDEVQKESKEYVKWLLLELKNNLSDLNENSEDAKLKIGKSQVYDLSFNRRIVLKDNSIKMNFEEFEIKDVLGTTGPIDPDLYTIAIYNSKNSLKAVIVNFTLHPAILVGHEWLISRDYINYLDIALKKKFGAEVVVYFANGAEGNINHLNYEDKNQQRGFEEAKRIGFQLGEYAIDNILKSKELMLNKIVSKKKSIKLPMRKLTNKDNDWADMVIRRDHGKKLELLDGLPDYIYAKEYKKMIRDYKPFLDVEIQVIKLGDLLIATLPGEVFVEIGISIKKDSSFSNTMIFGLSNDSVGYIPNEIAFSEGGYEIKSACTSQLRADASSILEKEVSSLIRRLVNEE